MVLVLCLSLLASCLTVFYNQSLLLPTQYRQQKELHVHSGGLGRFSHCLRSTQISAVHMYLLGHSFVIYTDHKTFYPSLLTKKESQMESACIQRWILILSAFSLLQIWLYQLWCRCFWSSSTSRCSQWCSSTKKNVLLQPCFEQSPVEGELLRPSIIVLNSACEVITIIVPCLSVLVSNGLAEHAIQAFKHAIIFYPAINLHCTYHVSCSNIGLHPIQARVG